jgi:hypothetical protein
MNNRKFFKNNGYMLEKDFASKDLCASANEYILIDEERNYSVHPEQTIKSHGRNGDWFFEGMLKHFASKTEDLTGLKLAPKFCYFRVYRPGNALMRHIDQDLCEITVSLFLGRNYQGSPWPIFIEDKKISMEVGDAAIFRGTELYHYRHEFVAPEGSYHSAVFFGYQQY